MGPCRHYPRPFLSHESIFCARAKSTYVRNIFQCEFKRHIKLGEEPHAALKARVGRPFCRSTVIVFLIPQCPAMVSDRGTEVF